MVEASKDLGPWRERVALAARTAMGGQPLFVGVPLFVELRFVMPRPASAPKRKTPPAVKRPDADKLARAVLDALTNTIFADDSAVVVLRAEKRIAEIGEPPGVHIRVEVTK
jgi:crossover junction endodeoxyribonuclease RusA